MASFWKEGGPANNEDRFAQEREKQARDEALRETVGLVVQGFDLSLTPDEVMRVAALYNLSPEGQQRLEDRYREKIDQGSKPHDPEQCEREVEMALNRILLQRRG